MSWRLAESLVVLRNQVNEAYPNRSKASDGTRGDKAHQATPSDHNVNAQGVVCAMDITDDPQGGFSAQTFLEAQLKSPHRDLKYMIFKGRIYSRIYGWQSRPNSGHYSHIHVSVGVGRDGKSVQPYDDLDLWSLGFSPIVDTEVFKVKNLEVAIVKVQTGNNGAGYKDIVLSKAGLTFVGYGFEGDSARGLSVACKPIGGNTYRVAVEGAPGAYMISVNMLFGER